MPVIPKRSIRKGIILFLEDLKYGKRTKNIYINISRPPSINPNNKEDTINNFSNMFIFDLLNIDFVQIIIKINVPIVAIDVIILFDERKLILSTLSDSIIAGRPSAV